MLTGRGLRTSSKKSKRHKRTSQTQTARPVALVTYYSQRGSSRRAFRVLCFSLSESSLARHGLKMTLCRLQSSNVLHKTGAARRVQTCTKARLNGSQDKDSHTHALSFTPSPLLLPSHSPPRHPSLYPHFSENYTHLFHLFACLLAS